MPVTEIVEVWMKRGTAAEWVTANPILAAGEPGMETNTGVYKIGDGVTAWISLSRFVSASLFEAKGDMIAATAAGTPARFAVGPDGQVVTADTASPGGMKWDVVPSDVTKADVISETLTDYSISANVLTLNTATGNAAYVPTAPTANFTLNITNAPTTDGKAITVVLFVVQGATGYIPSALQVAAAGQTIKWQGGTAPTPTSTVGKVDVFSFTLIRRSAAWTVLGSALLAF